MRHVLLALSVLGVFLFGGMLTLAFTDPLLVERAAREMVRIEVERRVNDTIETLGNARITDLARRVLQHTDVELAQAEQALREEVPEQVANVVADMLNADCECRRRLAEYARRSQTDRLLTLTEARERLVMLIESTYESVTRNLIREVRIFSASNAAAFALLGLVTVARRRAAWQLTLPAVVLLGAALVTGSLYLFNQDWLHTIIFRQYVGLWYVVYLAGVALLLSDVVFNRARVSTRIVNLAFRAAGSIAPVSPC